MKWFLVVLFIFILAQANAFDAKFRMEEGLLFSSSGFLAMNDLKYMDVFIE